MVEIQLRTVLPAALRNRSTTYSLISNHLNRRSEHAAQLKEPFVVAVVTNAAAHKKWSERGLCQDAGREIIGNLLSFSAPYIFPASYDPPRTLFCPQTAAATKARACSRH